MKTISQNELNTIIDQHELWRRSDYKNGLRAVLTGYDFRGCSIIARDLSGAYLDNAILDGVNLRRTVFDGSNFANASLQGSNLYRTNFNRAKFHNTNLTDAICQHTIFVGVDLTGIRNIDKLRHHGPSSIGYDTIEATKRTLFKQRNNGLYNKIRTFLKQCGLREPYASFLSYPLESAGINYLSTFISYNSNDEPFAKKLYLSLQQEGVPCWYAPEELEIGDKFEFKIDKAIREYDRLILICSLNSLNSKWVQKEIARVLRKEDRAKVGCDNSYLLPVVLDNYLFEWEHPYQEDILQRLYCDFSKCKDNETYIKAVKKLLKALKI
jgi:uncharacterized protein YjbI with pentapeptide repeats